MGITVSSLSGGVADPYAGDGTTPPSQQFPNAVYEGTSFSDLIAIDLTADPVPFVSIQKVTVTSSLSGNAQTLNNISGGAPLNDITYVTPTPQSNTLNSLSVTTTILPGNTAANVSITGIITGSFPDKFWKYKDTESLLEVQTSTVEQIPASNARLFLHRPSFMNFVSVFFSVLVEYDSANVTYIVEKRVLNNWETNRLALLNRLASE